jgi:hypothetical protein
VPPSPPQLPEVTQLLADAVESLPRARSAHEQALQIASQAKAMRGEGIDEAPHARASIDLTITALQQMKKPSGSKKDRERALQAVRSAVGVHDAYRALARALVLHSGGQPGLAEGATLRALVARLSVENDDTARRTAAQALFAVADALRALRIDPGDLGKRAEKLTTTAPLDYAPALRDALERAVTALRRYKTSEPAFAALASDANDAVQRFQRDRPFELQRSVAQDALRLIGDALTVASPKATPGP